MINVLEEPAASIFWVPWSGFLQNIVAIYQTKWS
jgi:hypothetical protein